MATVWQDHLQRPPAALQAQSSPTTRPNYACGHQATQSYAADQEKRDLHSCDPSRPRSNQASSHHLNLSFYMLISRSLNETLRLGLYLLATPIPVRNAPAALGVAGRAAAGSDGRSPDGAAGLASILRC